MKLHRFLSPFIILVVVAILSMANYVPGTYLSGWDTLHPEFNFSLYVQRIVYGSWQFHQGLGAASSQAHVGELPRMVILAPLITLLPDSLVRYSFFYLTLIVGSLGMYYCSRRVLNA
ncbi:hypothetical protein HY468_00320, partial [Candidatus Roizmanbacteria bacterium]|nr:hypothetical protein [Candidatus Roizmanbacteria bacterium]